MSVTKPDSGEPGPPDLAYGQTLVQHAERGAEGGVSFAGGDRVSGMTPEAFPPSGCGVPARPVTLVAPGAAGPYPRLSLLAALALLLGALSLLAAAPAHAQAPGKILNLMVTPGDTELHLLWSWSRHWRVTGYDVHYTSAPTTGTGAVADNAMRSGSDPAAAWVAASRSSTDTTNRQTISSLTNDTRYRVRVRAKNTDGDGPWKFGTGRPNPPPPTLTGLSLTASGNAVALSPRFAADTTEYLAIVPYRTSSVTVTPTWTATGVTVRAGSRTKGGQTVTSLGTISSSGGSRTVNLVGNQRDTRVTADITKTEHLGTHYRILVRRVPPPKPTGLWVTRGDGELNLRWMAPADDSDIAGYKVDYTSAVPTTAFPNDGPGTVWYWAGASGTNPANDWVLHAALGVGTTTTTITNLSTDKTYHVRVYAVGVGPNSLDSFLVFGEGRPSVRPSAPGALWVTEGDGRLDLVGLADRQRRLGHHRLRRGVQGSVRPPDDRLDGGRTHRYEDHAGGHGSDQPHGIPGAGAGKERERRRPMEAVARHPVCRDLRHRLVGHAEREGPRQRQVRLQQ